MSISDACELKAFLRRHPRIRGRTYTDETVHQVRRLLDRELGHGLEVNAEHFRLQISQALDQIGPAVGGIVDNYRIDVTNFPHVKITLQPKRTVELVVLDLRIADYERETTQDAEKP